MSYSIPLCNIPLQQAPFFFPVRLRPAFLAPNQFYQCDLCNGANGLDLPVIFSENLGKCICKVCSQCLKAKATANAGGRQPDIEQLVREQRDRLYQALKIQHLDHLLK